MLAACWSHVQDRPEHDTIAKAGRAACPGSAEDPPHRSNAGCCRQRRRPKVILGRIVHRHRIRLGISQEDLADQVELDRTYIGGIERGIRNPTLLVLLRLAVVLGVTPAELLAEQPGSGTS